MYTVAMVYEQYNGMYITCDFVTPYIVHSYHMQYDTYTFPTRHLYKRYSMVASYLHYPTFIQLFNYYKWSDKKMSDNFESGNPCAIQLHCTTKANHS